MTQRGSQAAYARHRGVDPSRVTRWKQQGRIPVGEDGLIDFDAADRALDESLDISKAHRARQIEQAARMVPAASWLGADVVPARVSEPAELPLETVPRSGGSAAEGVPAAGQASGGSGNAAADYWTHKALREATEAALAELKLRERLRELVELREVARAVREILARAANKLQQMPAQVAAVIVGIQDPQKVEALLAERVNQVINELARELDHLAAAAAAEQGEGSQ